MAYFPVAGQKKPGIWSCSTRVRLVLSTRTGSMALSGSESGGVNSRTMPDRAVAT